MPGTPEGTAEVTDNPIAPREGSCQNPVVAHSTWRVALWQTAVLRDFALAEITERAGDQYRCGLGMMIANESE